MSVFAMSLGPIVLVFVAALTVIVLPIVVVMHFVTKWKSTKGLSNEEQKMLEDLWDDSERMLERLEALETILDDRASGWRDAR